MTKDEALKLALEAMEITGGFDVEINAIKEALAQPEPEYLAFMDTPQRTWVGLTDDEIEKVYALTAKDYRQKKMPPAQIMFAKTIQRFLEEKNT